jgi:hypothetical protein
VGVKAGDILLTLNGVAIHENRESREVIAGLPEGTTTLELEYLAAANGEQKKVVVEIEKGDSLGYIPVPEWHTGAYLQVATSVSPLKNWWKKLVKRFKA